MPWRQKTWPLEFQALPPGDRKRIWNHCYWRALRRRRMVVWVVALVVVNTLILLGINTLIGGWTIGPLAARSVIYIAAMGILAVTFARWAAHLLRDELRACATSRCLQCFYDLTGNESGICPECGTPRRDLQTAGSSAASPPTTASTSSAAEASSACDAPSA